MFNLNTKIENLSLAQRGEKAAENYLKKLGYIILEKNYCNKKGRRLGEIDIIAKEKEELVFIEVKTRDLLSKKSSLPEENINHQKLYKLNKIASFYLSSKKIYSNSFRFDAISIISDSKNAKAQLRHIKNIFL